MFTITNIHAREILDSRGNPTIEVEVSLQGGFCGRAAVPSGASTGTYEAHELRDGNSARYRGKEVQQAVFFVVHEIRDALMGKTLDQKSLDEVLCALDGTPQKEKFGANAILGVSLAFAHAATQALKQPLYEYFRGCTNNLHGYVLPVPLMNVLNGGAHASGAIDMQEIMLVPAGAPSFAESLRCGAEIFYALRDELKSKGYSTGVGDEGGFTAAFSSNQQALDILCTAITNAGYRLGVDVFIALDIAASQLYKDGVYTFHADNKTYSSQELINWYQSLVTQYPIISIEDGLAEDDWDGFSSLTKTLGDKIQIVGDDLFVTNATRLQEGISRNAANAILIKPNQIGTISETIQAIELARANHFSSILSHRSGETEDTTIADMAVGLGAHQIKTGSLSRGERIAKYNQLLRIEESLGAHGSFAGKKAFHQLSYFN